jgi:hypothetical protein
MAYQSEKRLIEFLRNTAKKLRRLASQAPDITDELHGLADDAEARADRLEREGSDNVC